jgi:hypothetical protein
MTADKIEPVVAAIMSSAASFLPSAKATIRTFSSAAGAQGRSDDCVPVYLLRSSVLTCI